MDKHKRKQGDAICATCGVKFKKALSEIKRNASKNSRNFCSRSCAGKAMAVYIKGKGIPGNKRAKDEYSKFRPLLRRARNRHIECNLTLEDMLCVWNKQKGVCAYSGVKLKPMKNRQINKRIDTISLDRIDSSLPYTKDNIQFVSIAMNYLKNDQTHEEMLEIIKLLKT